MIDRESLRAAFYPDRNFPCLFAEIRRQGLGVGQYPNGVRVIATLDGKDDTVLPTYSMRQADYVEREMSRLPIVKL